MATTTLERHVETEALLRALPNAADLQFKKGRFTASCYHPEGDVLRGKLCYGAGGTLASAIDAMLLELEQARTAKPKLKTAAECKSAVLNLIREHDAAPAAFRDAVDELEVQ